MCKLETAMKTSQAHQIFISFVAAMLIAAAIAGSGLYGISSLQNGLERMSAKSNLRSAAEVDRAQSYTLRAEAAGLDSELSTSRAVTIVLAFLLLGAGGFGLLKLRNMTVEMRAIADQMGHGAAEIASASGQISSSSQSLAQGASHQAASLEETAASGNEITSMTRKNAENTKVVAELMTMVDQRVVESNRALQDMVQSMVEINASSGKIANIIKVIDEIAFQTNILALNAAVEAARAGEAGMGFAVGANEVRNLAQRSAQAARDTTSLIDDSIVKTQDGKQKLDLVADAIRSITTSAAEAKELADH